MQMKKDGDVKTIDLIKLAEGILKRLWMVILAMIIGGVAMFSYSTFMVTPLYQASALMYVNNNSFAVGSTSFSFSSAEISAAKSLVETYLVILETRLTLNEVVERGHIDRTYGELCQMIDAGSVNETEVFSVTITSDDPHEAEHIANTIAQVLPEKIADVVEGSSVRIVDYAVVPSNKVSPDIGSYTIKGLLLGLVLSCAVIVLIEVLDDKIHSEDYLLETYENIPLLTTVPDLLEGNEKNGYYQYYYYQHRRSNSSHTSKPVQRRDTK